MDKGRWKPVANLNEKKLQVCEVCVKEESEQTMQKKVHSEANQVV